MRLLLLASLRAQTGNGTTAQRIQGHLEAAGHVCTLKDTFSCESPLAVSKLISENFDAALGIHLYKAGRLLQGSGIPFGIVFGGTDINEDARCEKKAQVMGTVLDEARFAVSFTEAMRERAISYWPLARNKIYVQAQGIVTAPNISFNWKKYLQSAGITQDHNRLRFFFLICGLRRVKDPLYLVDAFVEWHREDPSIHLIIIGPAGGWGTFAAGDPPGRPSCCREELLCCCEQFHFRGDVSCNLRGNGFKRSGTGQEYPRKCCNNHRQSNWTIIFQPGGICPVVQKPDRRPFSAEGNRNKGKGVCHKAPLVGRRKECVSKLCAEASLT